MQLLHLIHWKPAEAEPRVDQLEQAGFEVAYYGSEPTPVLRAVRSQQPAAVVIDLTRLPSHGREVAVMLRNSQTTRAIPLVFAGGVTEKVAAIRKLLPDAAYSSWERIATAVRRAIEKQPPRPVVPQNHMQPFAGTPLVKKLGIKEGYRVALLGGPRGFQKILQPLPEKVVFRKQLRGQCDLIVWFLGSLSELEQRIDQVVERTGAGGLWIAWPKQASGVNTDVTQQDVRQIGLASGLVDSKICSIDDTWSGLRFSHRKG